MIGIARTLVAAGRRRLEALPLSTWEGIRSGFIVSTGRTGTQRLAEVVDAATSGVVALHEPPPDLFHIGEALARGSLSHAEAADALRRARQPACNRLKRRGIGWYVESNTNAAYLAAEIRAVFATPRFIHIVRDGPSVVRSLYSKRNQSRRPGQTGALFMDHDDARCRLAALDFPHDAWAQHWDSMSRFERVCWYWATKNALTRDALGTGEDTLVLRFEDIFDARTGFAGFWRMVDFLGLHDRLVRSRTEIHELLGTRSNRSAEQLLPPPAHWSADLTDAFERIAGAEQRLYYP